jgi:hypothetical protein
MVLGMHQRGAIPDLRKRRRDAPAKLAKAVSKSLAKDPGDRWQTAEEMRKALEVCGQAPPRP